jgi:hypothetical protein
MLQPLAPADESRLATYTNLSRSISLTILDSLGQEIPVRSHSHDPIELIIPRDPNLVVSPMTLQNVTSMNTATHRLNFNLHLINLTSVNTRSVSLHWEMRPLNVSLAYLLIYAFDRAPYLNQTSQQLDGWSLLCPRSKSFADKDRSSTYLTFI